MSWKTEASEEVIGRRAVQCHELSDQRLGLTTAGKPNPDGIFVLGEKRLGQITVFPSLGLSLTSSHCRGRQWWTWPECKQGFGYIPAG
jgi:hypothetical protein